MPSLHQQPLLSIVVPSWNRPVGLLRLLESIEGIDNPDLEIVISDDGSSETAMEPVRHWIQERRTIRFCRNDRNMGLVGNWNQALSLARGTWICFMCDDDYFRIGALGRILSFIHTQPVPCVVLQDPTLDEPVVQRPAGREAVIGLRLPIISGNFWHRSLTDHLGLFDPRLKYSPDAEFWQRLVFHYPQVLFQDPFAVYTLHEGNYAVSTWRKDDFLEQILLISQLTFGYRYTDTDTAQMARDSFLAQRNTIDTILRETVGRPERADIFRMYSDRALGLTHSIGEIQAIRKTAKRNKRKRKWDAIWGLIRRVVKRLLGRGDR